MGLLARPDFGCDPGDGGAGECEHLVDGHGGAARGALFEHCGFHPCAQRLERVEVVVTSKGGCCVPFLERAEEDGSDVGVVGAGERDGQVVAGGAREQGVTGRDGVVEEDGVVVEGPVEVTASCEQTGQGDSRYQQLDFVALVTREFPSRLEVADRPLGIHVAERETERVLSEQRAGSELGCEGA